MEFLRELGLASALIYHQRQDNDLAADTAFVALLASSALIYAILFLLAPGIGYFFQGAEGVAPIVRVLALTMLINGISQVPYTLLAKELRFRNKAIPEIVAGVANSAVAIALALSGYGVWSLVGGYVVEAVTRTLLVWFFSPWRPGWRFDWATWRELFAYGRHIVGSRVLIFGVTNIDDLFVARFLGPIPFGFYTLAYRLSNVPATHVTGLINNVMFPAFSKMQEQRNRVRRAYFESIHAIGLITIPLAVGTLALGPTFVHTYYLGKWDGAIAAMQWLAVYGLMRSIAANMGNIWRALGKPHWLSALALGRFVIMAALLYPALQWNGIVGVSILSAVISVIDLGVAAWGGNRLMGGGYWAYVRHLGPTLLAAGLSAGIGLLLLPLVSRQPVPYRLVPFMVAGTAMTLAYILLMWIVDGDFRGLVQSALRGLRRRRSLVVGLEVKL